MQTAAANFDAVIHCASSGGGGAESYRRVYLAGRAQSARRFCAAHRSFIRAAPPFTRRTTANWVDEESAAEPVHETGKILRETEELVRQNGGLVARLAGIYGPGRSALLRKFLAGDARIEGDGGAISQPGPSRRHAAAALHLVTSHRSRTERNLQRGGRSSRSTQRECLRMAGANWAGRCLPRSSPAPEQRNAEQATSGSVTRNLRALGWKPSFPNFPGGMEKSVLPAYAETGHDLRSGCMSREVTLPLVQSRIN